MIIIVSACIVSVVVVVTLIWFFVNKKSEDSEDEADNGTTGTAVEAPKPGKDEKEYVFERQGEKLTLIVPEKMKFKEGEYNSSTYFIGEYDSAGIWGHVNSSPFDLEGDCEKYTKEYLGDSANVNARYKKYTHKSGAVACVWAGYDSDFYIDEFYLIAGGDEVNLVVKNPAKEGKKLKKTVKASGTVKMSNGFEFIFTDGFESGDMSAWTIADN